MTHDFDVILSTMSDRSDWVEENYKAIEFALRLARKVTSLPTSEMMKAGTYAWLKCEEYKSSTEEAIKAMIQQAVLEVEGEK